VRISAKVIFVGRVGPDMAHDCADLINREAATAWGRGRPCAMVTDTAEIAAGIARPRTRGVMFQHGVAPDLLFGLLRSTP